LPKTESPTAREQFLAQLRLGWSVSKAAEIAGCGRPTAYGWREEDPAFRKAWDDAYQAGSDLIEDEARRRAVDGWDEPVFQGGQQIGEIKRYSDRLLERLLKGRKPEIYGEHVSVTSQLQSERMEIIIRYVHQEAGLAASRSRVINAEDNGNTPAPPTPGLPALPAPKPSDLGPE
jgi:hypothetical protein